MTEPAVRPARSIVGFALAELPPPVALVGVVRLDLAVVVAAGVVADAVEDDAQVLGVEAAELVAQALEQPLRAAAGPDDADDAVTLRSQRAGLADEEDRPRIEDQVVVFLQGAVHDFREGGALDQLGRVLRPR